MAAARPASAKPPAGTPSRLALISRATSPRRTLVQEAPLVPQPYLSTYKRDFTPKEERRHWARPRPRSAHYDFAGLPLPYARDAGADEDPERFVSATHRAFTAADGLQRPERHRGADFHGRPLPYARHDGRDAADGAGARDGADSERYLSATQRQFRDGGGWDGVGPVERHRGADFYGRPLPYALEDGGRGGGDGADGAAGRYVTAAQRQNADRGVEPLPVQPAAYSSRQARPRPYAISDTDEARARAAGYTWDPHAGQWTTTHTEHFTPKDVHEARRLRARVRGDTDYMGGVSSGG